MSSDQIKHLHQQTMNTVVSLMRSVDISNRYRGLLVGATIQDITIRLQEHPEMSIYYKYWSELTLDYPGETKIKYSSEGYIVLYLGNNHRHCIPLQLPDT